MDEKRFWDIIAVGCPVEPEASWVEALRAQLSRLPIEEIVSFARLLDAKLRAACTIDLWAVASLVHRREAYDFLSFRNWLVSRGKPVYEAALSNPDTLAERLQTENDFMVDLAYITRLAWAKATGQRQTAFWQANNFVQLPREEVAGGDWDFNDRAELRRRLPRLTAIYLGEEDVDE